MSKYYIEVNEKRKDDIPTKLCWLCVVKDVKKPKPMNGKKKVDKSEMDRHQTIVKGREKMFKALQAGHVNTYNKSFQSDNIINDGIGYLFNNYDYILYRINPLQAIKIPKQYIYNQYDVNINEFEIVTEIKSQDELLDQLIKDYDIKEFLWKAFEYGCFINKGFREKAIEIFEYANKHHNGEILLSDLIYKNFNSYEKYARFDKDKTTYKDLAKYLLDNKLITLLGEYEKYCIKDCLIALLEMNWFEIVKDIIDELDKELDKDILENLSRDKTILPLLCKNNDNEIIKYIINKLGIKTTSVTLKVYEYSEWDGKEEYEIKTFENMNELRSYLITKYQVPFDKASKDINGMCLDDYEFELV